ncbi:MAG TPA: hypothetical protein VHO06_21415 [Polyangia bacterium]|nr:hypothetical protein [Polyangia bacterium]
MSPYDGRRLVVHLVPVFLLVLGWPFTPAMAEQRAERVVVLDPAVASTDDHRCLTRIREELAAGGFEVETLDPGPRTDPVSIADAMKDQVDAVAVIALIGDPSTASAELWVLDRVGAQAQIHRIPLSVGDPEQVPEILAIRTIEVLRASALKQLVESSRPPAAPTPRAVVVPTPVPNAVSVSASRTVGIETGLALVDSIEGPGAAFIPVLRLRAQLGRTIFLRVGVAALGSRPTVATSIGSSSVNQAFALAEAGLAFRPGGRLRPLITVGAGGLRVDEVGQGVPPFQGAEAVRFAAILDGGLGLAAGLAPNVALVAEAHGFVAFPHPTIRFVDTTAATIGHPALVEVLTLAVWL